MNSHNKSLKPTAHACHTLCRSGKARSTLRRLSSTVIFTALILFIGCKEDKSRNPSLEGLSYNDDKFRIEQINFVSEGDTIRGSIVFPKEFKPCPAVVLIPGSGKSMRLLNYAKKFASRGVAAFTYDKRGVGESEGKYKNRGNASKDNLSLLAKDVIVAANTLSNHKSIDPDNIGLWAFSQGGWIAPIVISQTDDIKFSVMMSSPTVPVSMEMKYSRLTSRNPNFLECYTSTEIDSILLHKSFHERVYSTMVSDFDPLPFLKRINIPVLWIYGNNDLSIPVHMCIHRLQAIGKEDFEIWQYPECGHSLKLPGGRSVPANSITYDLIDWIQKRSPKENQN